MGLTFICRYCPRVYQQFQELVAHHERQHSRPLVDAHTPKRWLKQ